MSCLDVASATLEPWIPSKHGISIITSGKMVVFFKCKALFESLTNNQDHVELNPLRTVLHTQHIKGVVLYTPDTVLLQGEQSSVLFHVQE